MRRTASLTALTLGLALTGCSQASGENAPSTDITSAAASATAPTTPTTSTTPTTYELNQTFSATTSHGAKLTVEMPAEGPSDAEDLRRELSVDPISYTRVHIDNRQGTRDVSVHAVTIHDEDGQAYEFSDLSASHVADWGPHHSDKLNGVEGESGYTLDDGTVLNESIGANLNNRRVELHDKYLDGGDAPKLKVVDGWLASTETKLPERITGITIELNGMGEELPMSPGGEIPTASERADSGRSQAQDTPAATPAATVPEGHQETMPPPEQGDQLSNPVERPGELEGDTPRFDFTYDEAYRAWQSGMAYYDAFCVHYRPTTDGGRSQCEGIEAGTVDRVTGEYVGP